ncbi:MAG: hypothetical protein QM664_03720 [Flavihumibacter sp.]
MKGSGWLHYHNVNTTDYGNRYYNNHDDFLQSVYTRSSKETDTKIIPVQVVRKTSSRQGCDTNTPPAI